MHRPDPAGAERLAPDVEEIAQCVGALHGRLDVNDPVSGVSVERVEAAAAAHERALGTLRRLRARDPDAIRDLTSGAVDEDRQMRVDVEERLLDRVALTGSRRRSARPACLR